jgi:hypothetical protein
MKFFDKRVWLVTLDAFPRTGPVFRVFGRVLSGNFNQQKYVIRITGLQVRALPGAMPRHQRLTRRRPSSLAPRLGHFSAILKYRPDSSTESAIGRIDYKFVNAQLSDFS